MQLRSCEACSLMFRYPKDEQVESLRYYERHYAEDTVTILPDAATLGALVAAHFARSPYDVDGKIRLLKRFTTEGRVLDFGCSWGYSLHQLGAAGFDAFGFEVSPSRARYARERLGLEVITSQEELLALPDGSVDVIFANHVLEHLSRLSEPLDSFRRLLGDRGLLMSFVPNCGGRNAREQGAAWGPMIGRHHVLALDARFFRRNLPRYGFEPRLASDPFDADRIARAFDTEPVSEPLDGDELLVLARPSAVPTQGRNG